MTKILIATPTNSVIETENCDSIDLVKMELQKKNIECYTQRTEGVYVFKQRNILVETAIELGCTHIYFNDNDMVVPANIITRFLAHNKDIITTNYVQKAKRGKCTFTCKDANFNVIPLTEDSVGLQQVYIAPTGTMLIKLEALKKITDYLSENYQPLFWHSLLTFNNKLEPLGEDVHFTYFANKAGVEVWVDNDISKMVEHIGKKAFNWKDAI